MFFSVLSAVTDSGIKAPSVWSDSDFSGGKTNDIVILPEGGLRLGLVEKNVEDSFSDLNKIDVVENLSVDTSGGKIDVLKTTRLYGGEESDYGRACQRTNDGGYIITGSSYSYGPGGSDIWLIKTDKNGNEQWNKTFGGGKNDYGRDVQLTNDGGYIITGYTFSYGSGNHDVWLIKTDANGNKQWDRTFGGQGYEYGESVYQTSDGGYIITGCDYHGGDDPWSELYLIKTDDEGYEDWSNTFGGWGDFSWGYSVRETNDGGYIITGFTESYGNGAKDIWLIKTNSNGNTQWHKTFGGSGFERGYTVDQTNDGGYILVGYTDSYGNGEQDVWLIKTDSNGDETWNREFGGAEEDIGYDVKETTDGGYIISGGTWSYGAGNRDIWVIKTDGSGNRIWDQTYGGYTTDYAESICLAMDGGYTIIGTTYSFGAGEYDIMFMKIDPLGNCLFINGYFISENILESSAFSADMFEYVCNIPVGGGISVSFSKDSVTWYNSSGMAGRTDPLEDGIGNLNLSALGWSATSFHYRMDFSSPGPDSPSLTRISLSYREFHPSGNYESDPIDYGVEILTWNWISWSGTHSPDTHVSFQLRSSPSTETLNGLGYVGPDGTGGTYYTASGQEIWEGHDHHRWIQYKMYLGTNDTSISPFIENVIFAYNFIPKVEIVDPLETRSRNIPIEYVLYDGDRDSVDVDVQYRTGFSMYKTATSAAGANGTSNLASSPNGTLHTFLWDSFTDLGEIYGEDIFIRITPADSDIGSPDETVRFTVDNKPPEFISRTPADFVNSRTVTLIIETDENAFLRWSKTNLSYHQMTNQFSTGEGTMRHTTLMEASEGTNIIYIAAMDPRDNAMEKGDELKFVVDTVPPENIGVIINNDEEYTNSTRVVIDLMSTRDYGFSQYLMKISNDEFFSNTEWEPLSLTMEWNLSKGDGRKAVYVALMDPAGNVATFQGSIILDTTPPKISITKPIGEQDSTRVNITITTDEEAILRWSRTNSGFVSMENTFDIGQGTKIHSTFINASRGNNTFYISTLDLHGNAMSYGSPLTFYVNAKDTGNGGKGGEKNEDNDGKNTLGLSVVWWWIIAFLLLNAIVIIILLIIKKRARRIEEEPVERYEPTRVKKEELIAAFHEPPGDMSTERYESDSFSSYSGYEPYSPTIPSESSSSTIPSESSSSTIPSESISSTIPSEPGSPPLPPPDPTYPPEPSPVVIAPEKALVISETGRPEEKLAAHTASSPRRYDTPNAPGTPVPQAQTREKIPPLSEDKFAPTMVMDLSDVWNLSKSQQKTEKPGSAAHGKVAAPVRSREKAISPREGPRKTQYPSEVKVPSEPETEKIVKTARVDLASLLEELKSDIRSTIDPSLSQDPDADNSVATPAGKKSVKEIHEGLVGLLAHFAEKKDEPPKNGQQLARIPVRRMSMEDLNRRGRRREK